MFFEQEQHCTASAHLQKFCFDKHACFEGKRDDPSFVLEHINILISSKLTFKISVSK